MECVGNSTTSCVSSMFSSTTKKGEGEDDESALSPSPSSLRGRFAFAKHELIMRPTTRFSGVYSSATTTGIRRDWCSSVCPFLSFFFFFKGVVAKIDVDVSINSSSEGRRGRPRVSSRQAIRVRWRFTSGRCSGGQEKRASEAGNAHPQNVHQHLNHRCCMFHVYLH